jgi:hypothetical protein
MSSGIDPGGRNGATGHAAACQPKLLSWALENEAFCGYWLK